MTQRIRIALTLFLVLFSTQLFAQAGSTEAGVALTFTRFDSETLFDPEDPTLNIEVDIDGKLGFEASLNHFWTDRFSTELAVTSMKGDVSLSSGPLTIDVGEVDLLATSAIAQWHFGRGGRIDPYIGGGVAYITGSFDADSNDPEIDAESVDFENQTSLVAAAGLSFRLSERVVLGGNVKYMAYEAREEGAPDGESLDLNPLTLSTYIRLRF